MAWLTVVLLFLAAFIPVFVLDHLMRSRGTTLSPVLASAYGWAWIPLISRAVEGRPPVFGGTWIECVIFLLFGALFGYFMPSMKRNR